MKLTEIMTPDLEVVRPDASIIEAARKMRSLDVGVLPVTEGNQLVGIITDRDITVRAVADGRDSQNTRVQDCMSSGPVFCFEDQDSEEAIALMEEKQIRRVPVLSRDKRLAGIVSLADITTRLGKQRADRATAAVSSPASQKAEIPIARNANPAGVD
jgi:CBS domain-containing protein